MIDPNKPDLTNLPIGELVKTTKDFVWEVVGSGLWWDRTTKLTWGPIHKERLTHYEATEKYGDKLPTKEEFEEAEKHGIREIFKMEGHWFWSSSVFPNNSGFAHIFLGYFGGIGFSIYCDAVVLVGR